MGTIQDYELPALVPGNTVAKATGRTEFTVRRDFAAGRIPAIKIGSRWYVNREVLERILTGELQLSGRAATKPTGAGDVA